MGEVGKTSASLHVRASGFSISEIQKNGWGVGATCKYVIASQNASVHANLRPCGLNLRTGSSSARSQIFSIVDGCSNPPGEALDSSGAHARAEAAFAQARAEAEPGTSEAHVLALAGTRGN